MNFLKSIRVIVALVLTLTIIALVPVNTAAANNGKYVSEVYVAYGKDEDAAKKVLNDKGFTPVDGNLNKCGDTYVMMGYKTTDDIRESITDIAVMNMDGDFNTSEYKEVLRQKKTQVADMLSDFMSTIREYRTNYKAGKAKAVAVHDLLNKLTDDDSGKGLGDLFNSETFQDKVGVTKSITAKNTKKLPDLLTILMQGNAAYIRTVENLLSIAADTNENTWIDRFAQKSYDDMVDELEESRPDLNTPSKRTQYLDSEYGNLAENFSSAVAKFRAELLDYEKSGLSVATATEADVKAAFGDVDAAENEEQEEKIMKEELSWEDTGVLYEALKNYEGGNFKKGELLAFFLEEVEEDDTERYYPMAAALTEGQRGGMDFMSFRELLRYAFLDYDSWKKDVEKNSNLIDNTDSSIYTGINREMFKTDGSIAYTGAASRSTNVGSKDEDPKKWSSSKRILVGMWTITGLSGLLFGYCKIGMKVSGEELVSYAAQIVGRNQGGARALVGNNAIREAMIQNAVAPVAGEYDVFNVGVKIFKYVTLFLIIASSVYTIYTLSQKEEVKLKPIPKYFVDDYTSEEGESFQLNYQAVECNRADYNSNANQTGNSADLNADEGKQWLALYVSKNSMAGKPVTPDFKVTESTTAPNGMSGTVHLLGEKGAENLSNANYMNYSKLYSGYKTVKDKLFGDDKAYVFFKLSNTAKTYDESAGNMTATSMSGGMIALIAAGGLLLGAAIGAVITVLVVKNKKKKETA